MAEELVGVGPTPLEECDEKLRLAEARVRRALLPDQEKG